MTTPAKLSDAGKEELALALLLWKDFKADGKFDLEVLKCVALASLGLSALIAWVMG